MFGLLSLVVAVASAEEVTITFLHTNDVYQISPSKGWGGLAELATLLDAERARSDNTITTFGGDLVSPSVLSLLTKGEHMVQLMTDVGTDVAVVGNHEFDHGTVIAAQRFADSGFPWLGTNVIDSQGNPVLGLEATHIEDVGGLQVGFFGLITPDTGWLSSGGDVQFADPEEIAVQSIEQLESQGADVIVALTHMTIAEDRELAQQVDGIDLILGGHEHIPLTVLEGETLIHKSGYDARWLGVIDLVVDTESGEVAPSWRMIANRNTQPKTAIKTKVDHYNSWADEQLAITIGKTKTELDSRRFMVRTQETTMGNLICDAMRAWAEADVCITNGGGIRGDRIYDKGSKLTAKDIVAELPFGNVTVVLEVTGAQLRRALEHGVSDVEGKAGRFPQTSGLSMIYDPEAEPGSRVVAVTIADDSIDDDKTYTLATSDYLAGGGDGYAVFVDAERRIDASEGALISTVVIEHIDRKGKVAPQIEGRITIAE